MRLATTITALTLLLAACGGDDGAGADAAPTETATDATGDDAELDASRAAAEAATNLPDLEASADVTAVEVLDVADGSVTTLREAVTGDRPVLVWFWAPH